MFREMGELELKIRSIDKVRMISIYELTGIKDEPNCGYAAISVFYGKEDQINLCELDEGFALLVDRVFEIYNEAENKSSIVMDERTEKILKCGWAHEDDGFLEEYYNKEPVDIPKVAFESELSRRLLPIVEYMLDGIYKILGLKYEVTGSKAGWRGACVIYGLLNKNRVVSGLKIFQNNNFEYEVKLLNFIEIGNELNFYITIDHQKIMVEYSTKCQNIHGTGVFDLGLSGCTETHETYRDGKKIFYDSKSGRGLEKITLTEEEKNLIPWGLDKSGDEKNIDDNDSSDRNEMHKQIVVSLPWKDMVYILDRSLKESDSCKVNEFRCTYLYRKAGYSENRSWSGITCKGTGFALRPSAIMLLKMSLTNGESQTYFVPQMGTHKEKYRKKLEGRYFL